MDYIYISLQSETETSEQAKYWENCVLMHQYLLNVLRAEIWWRLRALNGEAETTSHIRKLVADLALDDHELIQSHLRECLDIVFSDNLEECGRYGMLLDRMDELAALRKEAQTEPDIGTLAHRAAGVLDKIEELRDNLASFPPLSDEWEIVIPLKLEANQWHCVTYKENRNSRSIYKYRWESMTLLAEVLEYNDGPEVRAESSIQGGRVYFRCGTRMRSLHPFVQVAFDNEKNDVYSIWMLQRMEQHQNGGCKGIDLKHTVESDYRCIPEFVTLESVQANRYITFTGLRDAEGNTCPLRNRYDPNYPDWCDQLQTINNTIRKLRENLNTPGCSLIYLYGSGGVGKTAAVQKLLEEYNVPRKHHDYEHIIFLSAKTHMWSPANGETKIIYDDSEGVQCFRDLPTLRKALRNIFGGGADSLGNDVPELQSDDYEQLYAGKSILLVLDDFESVSAEEQLRIVSYLRANFEAPPGNAELMPHRRNAKRRQVIITSRDSSIESLRSDILLPPLDMQETICLAKHFAKRFECEEAYQREFGQDERLFEYQMRRRKVFHDLSYGKPLVILSLVRNFYSADFPDHTRTEKELMQLLTKDTYKYLGRNDQCQALAVMAAYLADQDRRNTLERLRYIWERWNQGGDMERNLTLLESYTVLRVNMEKKIFVFTSTELCQGIMKSFQKEREALEAERKDCRYGRKQQILLSDNLLKTAKWLRDEQDLPIAICLMHRLQIQIRKLFRGENVEASNIVSLLKDLMGYEKGGDLENWEFRKTLQMSIAAYCAFPANLNAMFDLLETYFSSNYERYTAELIWANVSTLDGNSMKDSQAKRMIKAIKDGFDAVQDPSDRFVQLWGVLMMTDGLSKRGFQLDNVWGELIRDMLEQCMGEHQILSREDLMLLHNALLSNRLVPRIIIDTDQMTIANRVRNRDSKKMLFFKGEM